MKHTTVITLLLAVFAAGCVSNEPRQTLRPGGTYYEEIKSPAPRDLLFDPNCLVR